jgi:hypothetical protein
MHGRIYRNGNLEKIYTGAVNDLLNISKFDLGGLVPGNLLRVIEEAANEDPVEMQNGFKAFDGCSGKSNEVLSLL